MMSQSSQDKRNKQSAKSLSDVLGGVLEPVVARRTGMKLELIASWKDLVGPEFSETTRPEKIEWPRRAHEDDPFEPATLRIACEPSAALFFQHELAPITERVNQYFGFEAIKRIRIVQKPVLAVTADTKMPSVDLTPEEESQLKAALDTVTDPDLRKTLSRLGRGVLLKGKKSK